MPPEDKESTRTHRRHKRVVAREVTAEITARGSSLLYTVLNISTGGLLVDGTPPPRQALLEIVLRMAGTKSVPVTGRVVHELPQGIGVAFEPFSSTVAESLEKFIAAVDAKNNLPPPLPPRGLNAEAPSPTSADPFFSGPDPRPPRSGSPDERIDYLRALVKKRDESLQRGKALLATVTAEVDELRAYSTRLKSKLDATAGQLALGEAALAASRKATEKHAAELEEERATAQQMLEQEQRGTLEAIATVAGLEMKMRRFESSAQTERQEAEAARRQLSEMVSESAGLKKTREELGIANRKAMENQVALTKERTSRMAADEMIREARSAQQAAESEAKQLSLEMARLKAKLIAAENALERSATKKTPERSAPPPPKR